MANLSRALGRFSGTPIYGWVSAGAYWTETGLSGRLQVFDRFITERDFGQRKRVLTMPGDQKVPNDYKVLRLGDSDTPYIVESSVEDVEGCEVYGTVLTLHEAPYKVQICKMATSTSRSGVQKSTGEQVLATTWVDISRYSSVDSREFSNTDYTIYTVYFPANAPLSTDYYLKRLDNNQIIDINEVFQALDVPAARCQRRG